MKKVALFIGLFLSLTYPALASEHVAIAFRNPITATNKPSGYSALAAMVILQSYDSINSARAQRNPGEIETNWQYHWAAKHGVTGYALSFAAWDALELMVAKKIHASPEGMEIYQAEQSASGIIYTNALNRK